MASSTSAPPAQEFVVRVPKECKKKYGVMKFNPNNKVDFTKCGGAKIERENNLKDYKAAHNLETMPQFGAGSEYGRDLREEARLKKLGINRKAYLVENQPWKLKLGTGKTARHFKGTKEGGILENASYYIFTQCPDGAFEAFPLDEWHQFNPVIKYKHLTAEEAEEQYSKREKIMNIHSIMVQKRIRDNVDEKEEEEEEKKGKAKKKGKDFMLTDLDDWAIMSDDSDGEGRDSEDETPREKKSKKTKVSKKSGDKRNSEDEAVEESDEEDEGREVDYMTDTDSEDDDMYADKDREAGSKYQEKGVEDEEALQKLIESDEEEEEEKKEEDEEDPEKDQNKGSGSDSSSSSDSDTDPEKDGSFTSALFMPKKDGQDKKKKGKGDKDKLKSKSLKRKGSFSSEGSSASRSTTPTVLADTVSKPEKSPVAKKTRTETSTPTPTAGSEGVSEETVRRYLMRKPMTTTDLLHKLKNCGLPKDKLVSTVADILKKINPEKTVIKDKMYLAIKH